MNLTGLHINGATRTSPFVAGEEAGMKGAVITIVGVGLISGSFAIAMREKGFAKKIIGVGRSDGSIQKAKELGIIDEALSLEGAVKQSDFIYVAIPVDATVPVIQQVMEMITDQQIVVDAGSTKNVLCEALAAHPMRKQFVATHPMWGTEYSGPEAAVRTAFAHKAVVICDSEHSDPDALELV